MAKVYVSSTFIDLQKCREEVKTVLRRMGHEDIAMEYYVAEDQRPVSKCLADVAACDLYVGVFAWRYGWRPKEDNPQKYSITEMEYRQAINKNKPCLIFMLSEDAPWSLRFVDKNRNPINKLRAELSSRHSLGPHFKSSDDLGKLVAEAIHRWEKEQTYLGNMTLENLAQKEKHSPQEKYVNYKDSSFDDQACNISLYDIDEDAARSHIRKAAERGRTTQTESLPLQVILDELGLCSDGALTRAAVLLFGKKPQKHFPQAKVKCGRFKGVSLGEVIDEKVIDGTLLNQVNGCERFFLSHIRRGWIIEGFDRKEKWEYPLEALREAIVNAIVHRDYTSKGEVQIRIFDDRIEIWNPCQLPDFITVEDLLDRHISYARNKLLAECFHQIGLIEQWGSGIQRILDKCKSHMLPIPEFTYKAGSFFVTMRGPEQEFGIIPRLDLAPYYNALNKRYQRIDLDALTPPQKEEYLQLQLRSVFVEQSVRENPPPVELTKELMEKLERGKEIHPEDLPANLTLDDALRAREVYYGKPSWPVLDAVVDSRHQHAIILGDPGSGKSTLSRYVLLSLITDSGDEKLRRAFDGYLPLLIELRSYAWLCAEGKCETFLEFLEYMGKTEGWHLNKEALHHHLKTDGRAVVIFDGLDEIFEPGARETVARRIAAFASDYPKARIIATSRIIGYRRKILEDAGFTHFTLQDLDQQQVATFVDRWYSLALSDRPDEAMERRERIIHSFKESDSIRQLAGNPMLLTIMAIIGKHQELPRERWKLYEQAASVLIQHWDINKHLKESAVDIDVIGEDDKKELLRRLAYRMQSGAGGLAGNYIHQDLLQEEFEGYLIERYKQTPAQAARAARTMIDQFRERNFILSLYGAHLYGFVHRAFLEYFCATAFVYRYEKTQEMTIEQLKQDIYGAHYQDRSWHEVLRLICGMIDERFAGEVINYLTNDLRQPWSHYSDEQPPWNIVLAVQCLGELRNLGTVAESSKQLLEVICSLFSFVLTRKGYMVSVFLEESVAPSIEDIGPNWPHRNVLANWLRALVSVINARSYAKSFGRFVGSVGKGEEEIHRIILDYATHSDENYRILAPFTLTEGWHDEAQTLLLLHDRAVNDVSQYVRGAAVEILGEQFRDDERTLPLLHDRTVNDESAIVRSTATQAISQLSP